MRKLTSWFFLFFFSFFFLSTNPPITTGLPWGRRRKSSWPSRQHTTNGSRFLVRQFLNLSYIPFQASPVVFFCIGRIPSPILNSQAMRAPCRALRPQQIKSRLYLTMDPASQYPFSGLQIKMSHLRRLKETL